MVNYKISIKAEDLEKALNPYVWPLRVKGREFIHYKGRSKVSDLCQGQRQPTGSASHGTGSGNKHRGNAFIYNFH